MCPSNEPTPRQLRLELLEEAQAEAAHFLAAANHETMKTQVRLARRDIDEALVWLKHDDVENNRHLLALVDLLIDLATSRMDMVGHRLQTYGPDVSLTDSEPRP